MSYKNELEILTAEYIRDIGLNNILNLKILIPDFKGSFFIFTDKQLIGRINPSEKTELCFLFDFKLQCKKSYKLLATIDETKCFDNFIRLKNGNHIEFVKKTGNNLKAIVTETENIIKKLFPTVDSDLIKIELGRILSWHKLKENKTSV